MYTKAIDFQNKYVAIDAGFASAKSEDEKVLYVANKFFGGDIDSCKKLVDFIKDKAGGLLNRNALVKAKEDYLESVKKESEDAEAELQKNLSEGAVEKAEADLQKATQVAKKAKGKSRINLGFKILLLCVLGAVLASGSLAIFSPLINAVALLLGGLSGATLMGLGVGVWLYAPKIKEWWNSKDKDKGKNRILGNYYQEESDKADKAFQEANKELGKQKGVRTSLERTAEKTAEEFAKTDDEFKRHPGNLKAREEINNLVKAMVDGQKRCEEDAGKSVWATTSGRKWLKYGITRLEKAFATGQITDANYESELEAYARFFNGDDGIFNPSSPLALDFNRSARSSSAPGSDDARKFAEDEDGFWA